MGTNTTTSYLDPPQLIGRPNADGTISLTPLELKRLNDYNYYVAKMLQGGLNLANLNEATNKVFTGMVTFTDLSDPTKSTVINGDHITTGTISADRVTGGTLQGVEVISRNPTYDDIVELKNGSIFLRHGTTLLANITPTAYGTYIEPADGNYLYLTGDVQLGLYDSVTVHGSSVVIASDGNMSINSSGKTYIATNASYSGDVDIGQTGGTINLVGTVNVNGVPI